MTKHNEYIYRRIIAKAQDSQTDLLIQEISEQPKSINSEDKKKNLSGD